ncbi:Cof-type HAD-IIB family hydrolase [Loigolactobacillus zhaoyuanensis]|uniref:Cof-type HAD-IIB family hydrolase n=1 Tax=Loigolactobacillus zhaoyuanensis TaxID=2486017 RepID=A0ABW8UD11_9LACO|nr:Cof-type HAD-IIB family hydrolase [Loigolactobacillus zhaoyuanensis]
MYKLIVCDLDETLLDREAHISKENEQAIKAFVAQGGHFVPNTGRSFLSIQDDLQQLGLAKQSDQFVIAYNGGAIVENAGNQVLATNPLDFATIKQIYDIARSERVSGHIYTLEHLYVWQPSASEQQYLDQRGVQYEAVTDDSLAFLRDQPLMKILLQDDDPAKRQALAESIPPQVATPLATTFSSGRYVEFNHVAADKGKATLQLAAKLGITTAEIMALGDNSNDLAMIKAAGLGVSVQNGTAEVKAAADYVTTADHAHSGVAEAIEKFALH